MVCCVTGHRPEGFPFDREDEKSNKFLYYIGELETLVESAIEAGVDTFISGMAYGADLDFADTVIYLRETHPNIKLEAALPHPLREMKIHTPYSKFREELLEQCDKKTIVSPYYFKGCMQKRNRYMVDNSNLVIAIWNGKEQGGTWDTIKYARMKGKPIKYIMLNDLKVEKYVNMLQKQQNHLNNKNN